MAGALGGRIDPRRREEGAGIRKGRAMAQGSGKRGAVALIAAALATAWSGGASGEETAAGESAIAAPDDAYAEASRRYGVPEPLLRALADVESFGRMVPGFVTRDGRRGLTGLVAGRTLERAAALTGQSVEDLSRDPRANVLGGAAVLAEVARSSPSLEETLVRWAGFDVPAASRDFAERVLARLEPLSEYERMAAPFGAGFVPGGFGPEPPGFSTKARPDYPGARWVGPACDYTNASRTGAEFVIIHTCEGSFSGCWGWLVGCHDVSAHYVVSTAGEVVQCVENEDTAWHVGCLNARSIGIEHEGSATRPENFTDAMYCASSQLTRWICDNFGVPCDRDHVIGHNEANELYCHGDHWDPGPGWDWAKYMDWVACGCSGCTPTRPVLTLRAEIDDVPGQERDRCLLYESAGIFDLWTGQTTVQRFYVANEGDGVGRNVVVGLWIEEPYLRLRHWDIYDNWPTHPCGAEWCLNDANSHPENPPHDDPGATPMLHLYALSPGETKMIELTVEATASSLLRVDHPDVRLWVRHVDDYYEKADFWSTDFNNVNGYQTFNGGDLRIWTQTDVLAVEACEGSVDEDCDGVTDEDCAGEEAEGDGGDAGPATDDGGPVADGSADEQGDVLVVYVFREGCHCAASSAPRYPLLARGLLLAAAAVVLGAVRTCGARRGRAAEGPQDRRGTAGSSKGTSVSSAREA